MLCIDSITKSQVKDVKVIQVLDAKDVVLTVTSAKGYFKVKKLTKLGFGMETHNLTSLILLKKQGYLTDTIEIYGASNEMCMQKIRSS